MSGTRAAAAHVIDSRSICNTLRIGDFGTPSSPSLSGRMLTLLKTAVGLAPRPHNPNVSVQVMQGRWLAMTETPESIAFDAASLRTLYAHASAAALDVTLVIMLQ